MTSYHYLECDKCKAQIQMVDGMVSPAQYPLKEGWMHFFEGIMPMVDENYVRPDDFYADLCGECMNKMYPLLTVKQGHAHFDTTGNGFCDECDKDLYEMGS